MWLNKKESQTKPESPDSTTHKSDPADSGRLSKYALKQEKKRLKKDAKVSYNNNIDFNIAHTLEIQINALQYK